MTIPVNYLLQGTYFECYRGNPNYINVRKCLGVIFCILGFWGCHCLASILSEILHLAAATTPKIQKRNKVAYCQNREVVHIVKDIIGQNRAHPTGKISLLQVSI